MRNLVACIISIGLSYPLLAGQPPLERFGRPLQNRYCHFEWDAPTNNLPATLSVYRVLPSKFPAATISNLVSLGNFKSNERVESLGRPGPRHPRTICYSNATRSLGIYPDRGFIEYRDRLAIEYGNSEGVPTEREALGLARSYLSRFAISPSETASDSAIGRNATTIYRRTSTNPPSPVDIIDSISVSFTRRLDGIDFFWRGGCFIEFGHQAKIHKLEISWRNLEKSKSYPVASPETILTWMREGKCFWQLFSPESQSMDFCFTRVAVKKVIPKYYGETEDALQDRVYPFAYLLTEADIASTTNNTQTNVTVWMCCPLIDQGH